MTTKELKQTIIWYLDNYWNVIATIANFRNDIIFSGTMKDLDVPIPSGEISDVTFKKAVKLIDKNIDEMMDWIKIINDTYYYYRGNDVHKANLIYYTYIQKIPESKRELIQRIFVSQRAYYYWLDDICKVAGYKAISKKLIEL
jgi:hypothetical protein